MGAPWAPRERAGAHLDLSGGSMGAQEARWGALWGMLDLSGGAKGAQETRWGMLDPSGGTRGSIEVD